MLEGGVGGGVREALLISLERTNTLSALYVYRDIRYKTTGIIQSGRNLYRNPSFRFKPHQQSRRQLFFIIKMFYTVNHCIVPFDWKQLCGAFFAERRGGAADFYTYTRTTLQKTKNLPCQRRRHFTDKLLPEKEYYRVLIFLQD